MANKSMKTQFHSNESIESIEYQLPIINNHAIFPVWRFSFTVGMKYINNYSHIRTRLKEINSYFYNHRTISKNICFKN